MPFWELPSPIYSVDSKMNDKPCLSRFGMALLSLFFLAASSQEAVPPSLSGRAEELVKEGKYLEARSLYEKTLEDPALNKDEKDSLQKNYEALNLKILFSRFESPESIFHQVLPGESLYKIAQKYKTTVDLLKKSNGLNKGTIYPAMKLKVVTGTFSIHVSKSQNELTLLLNDKPLKHYRVATGANNGTPAGEFRIVNKLENPTWFKTGAVIAPSSPDNALGTRWLGFDHPGYGIHGTIDPNSIGRQVTSGCVRMFNSEVEELYSLVPAGTKVVISD